MTTRGIVAWITGSAIVLLLFGLFVAVSLSDRPRYPCNVPSLESNIPMTTVTAVPRPHYFVESCPMPIPQEARFEREYGFIQVFWWGSPHRLYMAAKAADGRPLVIDGSRVERFEARGSDDLLSGYTNRVTFVESSIADSAAAETFTIEVRDGSQLREEIELRYVPRQCTCVYDPL
jgi:hypothetical protein